jgi:ankyrin repeat protein
MVIEAIRRRDEAELRGLVAQRPELADERDENGVSALMLSYYYGVGGGDALRAARSQPLDVFEAATVGDISRLAELLDAEPELARARSADDGTALHFAAFFGQPDAAKLLIERGADIHAVASTFGNVQPLHSAVASGNVEAALALLAAGADPNARQERGFTPLHGAAQNGDRMLVDALLERGADPAATNDEGKAAADFAAEAGHEELATRLRGSG